MLSTSTPNRDARPRFEFYPLDSPRLQTVHVEEFPFIIGRTSGASLQINSTSVSREHAEIAATPTGYCIRDLNSTNGTSVNGRRVKESPLVDGDSVSVADAELTFICTSMGRLQRTLTKPLPGRKPGADLPDIPAEVVAARSMSEALLLQAIPLEWRRLCCDVTQQVLLSSARMLPPLREWMASADAKYPTSVASRLELLGWQLSAEQLSQQPATGGLLLSVNQREMLDDRLIDAVDDLSGLLGPQHEIGVALHWEWATDVPETARLLERLRERGVVIAHDEFSGGGSCIESMDQAAPDYLLLSSQVVRGAADQPRRLQRLELVQAACDVRGIRAVTPAGVSEDDKQLCRQIGIQISQQSSQSPTPQPALEASVA